MSLRIKDGVSLEQLREFGFVPGYELAQRSQYTEYFNEREYQLSWWHKFATDSETGAPLLDEYGNPRCQAWVDENRLWFDVMPWGTYHAEMSDLDIVTDTVFALSLAGLIEKEDENGN